MVALRQQQNMATTLTLKNIPDEVYDRLRLSAATHRRSLNSEAIVCLETVRLPREFRFEGDEVFIKRIGSAVILLPKAKSWDALIDSLAKFPDDFMTDREQPPTTDRREGL